MLSFINDIAFKMNKTSMSKMPLFWRFYSHNDFISLTQVYLMI